MAECHDEVDKQLSLDHHRIDIAFDGNMHSSPGASTLNAAVKVWAAQHDFDANTALLWCTQIPLAAVYESRLRSLQSARGSSVHLLSNRPDAPTRSHLVNFGSDGVVRVLKDFFIYDEAKQTIQKTSLCVHVNASPGSKPMADWKDVPPGFAPNTVVLAVGTVAALSLLSLWVSQ